MERFQHGDEETIGEALRAATPAGEPNWSDTEQPDRPTLVKNEGGDAPEGSDWVYADRNRGAVQTQNARGEWVPAIPLPIIGRHRMVCHCGVKRWGWRKDAAQRRYREHYALAHILRLT